MDYVTPGRFVIWWTCPLCEQTVQLGRVFVDPATGELDQDKLDLARAVHMALSDKVGA